tara:strand:+ start:31298 stop:31462 length:165 start_codon:yes stop_codon:yes gene_type:complete
VACPSTQGAGIVWGVNLGQSSLRLCTSSHREIVDYLMRHTSEIVTYEHFMAGSN